MALRGPKGAHPTPRGWVDPKTGELLKSQRISRTQIDRWFGNTTVVETKVETDDVVRDFNNDGVIDELEKMTKAQLEEYGRTIGIELDRRLKKETMINNLKEYLA
jgi:hypothetical protein